MPILIIPLLLSLVSCSLQKIALRSSTPVFQKSSDGMMSERDWDIFRASAPANIKMMELIWQQDDKNLDLLSVLIKAYAGYAFAVHETLAFGEELSGQEVSPERAKAIEIYTRAFDYGLRYLEEKGVKKEDLLTSDETKLAGKLKEFENATDIRALLYTAQAWGSLINLQKYNVALVSQVPKVKLFFDRVCEVSPDIDHNVCDIFYAQYEASRPRMLGGNPEKAEQLFLNAMENHPLNLLIRVNYIQSVIVPLMDGEKYDKTAALLREEFTKFEDQNRDSLENTSPYRLVPALNLYNAIAKKRFEFVEKHKKKIF